MNAVKVFMSQWNSALHRTLSDPAKLPHDRLYLVNINTINILTRRFYTEEGTGALTTPASAVVAPAAVKGPLMYRFQYTPNVNMFLSKLFTWD